MRELIVVAMKLIGHNLLHLRTINSKLRRLFSHKTQFSFMWPKSRLIVPNKLILILMMKKKIIFSCLRMIKIEVKREALEEAMVVKVSKKKVCSTKKMKILIWRVMTKFSNLPLQDRSKITNKVCKETGS